MADLGLESYDWWGVRVVGGQCEGDEPAAMAVGRWACGEGGRREVCAGQDGGELEEVGAAGRREEGY